MRDNEIVFSARILRKQPDLPRYIVIAPGILPLGDGPFSAQVSLNGCPPFGRTIRPWRKGSNVYFFNLTEPQCRKAGADTGDECEVIVRLQD